MAPKRTLPEARNPLLAPEHVPSLETLVERRRLGQTNLAVRRGQAGVTNATKAENLGKFDYAHLRVPLPKDLSGSGIFTLMHNLSYPESYFLMRRSTDGFVSATGMFKAAFPWATTTEEESERTYQKKLPTSGPEEVAGNIWVAPETALRLAEEYHLKPFIVALLDPSPIEKASTRANPTSPPTFQISEEDVLSVMPSQPAGSVRKRTLRSASPSKIATPSGRKIASPRKRTGRKPKSSLDETASANLQAALENGETPSIADSTEGEKLVNGTGKKGSKAAEDDTVKVIVDETTEKKGNKETIFTNVKVEMPAGKPGLPLPQDSEAMVAKAKEMVDAANKLEATRAEAAGSPTKKTRGQKKRKVDEVEDAEEADNEKLAPQKKIKVLQEKHRKDKVRTRAMVGITAALGIGTLVQYFI